MLTQAVMLDRARLEASAMKHHHRGSAQVDAVSITNSPTACSNVLPLFRVCVREYYDILSKHSLCTDL